jgi:hypothetical protein
LPGRGARVNLAAIGNSNATGDIVMIGGWRWVLAAVALLLMSGPASGPTRAADAPVELKFTEFYQNDFSVEFSDKLKELAGKSILVRGFMAPPLRADAAFMVVTREPVYLCPYCDSDESWPRDTLVVYMRGEPRFELGTRIRVAGKLDVGSKLDPLTGFVSMVRLVDAEIVR